MQVQDTERVGVVKEIIKVIFGVNDVDSDKIIRQLKSLGYTSQIRTPNLRTRIGGRALKYLRNAIEIARHEGIEKHEKEREYDNSKNADIEPLNVKSKSSKTDKKTNESHQLTFPLLKEMQLYELMIDVDATDEREALNNARSQIRKAKRAPQRAVRDNFIKAKDEFRSASSDSSDTAEVDKLIARKKMELAQLQRRRQSIIDKNKRK